MLEEIVPPIRLRYLKGIADFVHVLTNYYENKLHVEMEILVREILFTFKNMLKGLSIEKMVSC